MPYIITTLKPNFSDYGAATAPSGRHYDLEPEDDYAVATLGEAQQYAAEIHSGELESDDYNMLQVEAYSMGEPGGDLGPLSDGTVIEVRLVKWEEIYASAAWRGCHL